MMAPATFNPNQPGWYDYGSMTLVEFPGGYYSPWDIWERPNMNVPYEIFNNVPGLTMNVRAYIGLAYYDDVDNGLYQDTFTGNMINLASGNYPNLYANNQEIGNLLLSRWITAEPELIFRGSGGAHCPIWDGNGPGYNPNGWFFDLPTATPQEKQLLSEYGKVFFYEVEVRETATGIVVPGAGGIMLQVECESLPDPAYVGWEPITNPPGGPTGTSGYVPLSPPGVYTGILSYHKDLINGPGTTPITGPGPGAFCDSREIVYNKYFDNNTKATPFTYNGNQYYVDLTMSAGHPMWLSARLNLTLRQI